MEVGRVKEAHCKLTVRHAPLVRKNGRRCGAESFDEAHSGRDGAKVGGGGANEDRGFRQQD